MPTDLMDVASPGLDAGSPGGFDAAPGSVDGRSADLGSYDPLVSLGLVDPRSGQALPTDDWAPAQPQAQPQVAPAPQPAPQPAPLAHDVGQQLNLQAATLQAQAATAYAQAVAQGVEPAVAQAVIGSKLEAEIAKASAGATRQAALPNVKAQVAAHIAGKLGGGAVTPQDLMVYDSPAAMEAAASQLAQARRATSYQQRRAAGVDRAEGASSPAGINPAIAGLSPAKKIELGIRRGQY
jgi:hypothetical protein